jgi:hypothetical protein
MSMPLFELVENFQWLISQLSAFVDPQYTYDKMGRPDLKGGQRRIFRYDKHFQAYYKEAKIATNSKAIVDFGGTKIECDKFIVSHAAFKDPELKEKYPKPESGSYLVMATSRDSLKNNTAKRYYVSCTCTDFQTTFKEKLISYGYTSDDGTLPPSKGLKKLAPAVCKHIYAVLLREYKDIIDAEGSAKESAEINTEYNKEDFREEPPEYNPGDFDNEQPSETMAAQKNKPGRQPKSDSIKKKEYEAAIRSTLRFFNNSMPNNPDVYKDTRRTDAYKKYKFMVKSNIAGGYGGWLIVFTNPLINPFRDKLKNKELVPILAGNKSKLTISADAIVVYTKYFSKDELMNMIKSETREIQPSQIEKLNKTLKKYTLTESLECLETSSLLASIMEIC